MALDREGIPCGAVHVERLMRELGMAGVCRGGAKRRTTTFAEPTATRRRAS